MIKRECHKCELNGKGDPRCIECPGPADISLKGRNMVYPDGQPNPAGIYSQRIDLERGGRDTAVTERLARDTEDALVQILACVLEFDDLDWAILKRKYQGKDGAQIAKELGTSKQVVHIRLQKLVKSGPRDGDAEKARRRIAMAIVDAKRRGAGGAKRGVYRTGFIQDELFK